jgi:fatty acid desaturase
MTANEVRKKLREMLPRETFEPKPLRGAIALAVFVLAGALVAALYLYRAPWYVLVPGSLVIGQMWAHSALAAHESLHGALFRSRFWTDLLGYLGFAPALLGCETWRAWHVRSHHAFTQDPSLDPDMVGPYGDYRRGDLLTKVLDWFTIGSRRPHSVLSLLLQFSVQGQLVLWYHGTHDTKFKDIRFDRGKAKLETFACVAAFVGLGWLMGFWYALWLLIIPALLANLTFMSYICTQHFLRPLTEHNDPLANAMSVRTNWLLDIMHLQFSYHREHHLFPNMNHGSGPRVRAALLQLGVPAEPPFTHLQALKLVFQTPRLYETSHVLRAASGERVDLHAFWARHDPREAQLVATVPTRAIVASTLSVEHVPEAAAE